MLGNWVSTAGAVGVVLLAVTYRLRIEERALTAALPTATESLRRARARLIPYLW